jgi:excisionase family DNA binding protein
MSETAELTPIIQKLEQAVATGTPAQNLQLFLELERLRMLVFSQVVKQSQSTSEHFSPEEPSRLLTIPEVANVLQIPCGRCYELSRQGVLPTIKIGKYIRVSQAALHAWLAQQQHMHASQWGEASQGRDMRGCRPPLTKLKGSKKTGKHE